VRQPAGLVPPGDSALPGQLRRGGCLLGALVTIHELKTALAVILCEEEQSNWNAVEKLSEHVYVRLTTEAETPQSYPHEEVVSYLAGFMRRRSDEAFAEHQRRWLKSYL
jgi:hypothetical protein